MVGTRRYLSLAGENLLGSAEVVVELRQAVVGAVALELGLLLGQLADSLRLQPNKGPVVVLKVTSAERQSKASVVRSDDATFTFTVGRNQAEYFHAVLLRAYRDGMAEVNHVHLEGELEGAPFDFTAMFELSREPMSSDEASALLGG